MTEDPPHYEKPMCVRLWLEVGHACEPRRSALGRALALDWRVWVKGVSGQDISPFVHKVVFYLHPASAFVYPKRVIQEPPYEIQESGCASIEIPIHVYLKHSDRPRRIRLRYSLCAESASRSCTESRTVFYDVENPSEPLWRELVRAGGEVVARTETRAGRDVVTCSHTRESGEVVVRPDKRPGEEIVARIDTRAGREVVARNNTRVGREVQQAQPTDCLSGLLEDAERERRHRMKSKYKFAEPTDARKPKKCKTSPECVKSSEAVALEFRKQLKSVDMTDDEMSRVWRLYTAVARYEKSADALPLPPFSDPIYRVPELPLSLRSSLSSVEADLAMQWRQPTLH